VFFFSYYFQITTQSDVIEAINYIEDIPPNMAFYKVYIELTYQYLILLLFNTF